MEELFSRGWTDVLMYLGIVVVLVVFFKILFKGAVDQDKKDKHDLK